MRVKMVRIDDSGCFGLPIEHDIDGIKINRISIDNNIIPISLYNLIAPRTVDIIISIPKETDVYADIIEL